MGQFRADFVEKLYQNRQSVLTKTAQRWVTAVKEIQIQKYRSTISQLLFAVHRLTITLLADSQATKKFSGTVMLVPTAFPARQFRADFQILKTKTSVDNFSAPTSFF